MLRLIILRHAKSSWTIPGQSDFERGLNDRGISDLPKISQALAKRGYIPDQVYCSAATRTKLTASGILAGMDTKPNVEYLKEMYSGGLGAYVEIIGSHRGSDTIMLIGHNPICHALAINLMGDGEPDAMAVLHQKYPTGAAAVLDFDAQDWSQVEEQSGRLVDFVLPRNL